MPGPRARGRNHMLTVVFTIVFLGVLALLIWALNNKHQLDGKQWTPYTKAEAVAELRLARPVGHAEGDGRRGGPRPGVRGHLRPRPDVGPPVDRLPAGAVVEFFRAIPVLIMMFFAYLNAQEDIFPSKHLALAGVITGLTLYNGAVIAEIVRAGVNALPRGQSEAASAWDDVGRDDACDLFPQAITSMLPVLISQLVVEIKDSSIGFVITFVQVVRLV